MKEIEVKISCIAWTNQYEVWNRTDDSHEQDLNYSWLFAAFPAALAFCEYHKLTVTGYFRNGAKVTREEME